jgi:solute carrier family 35 (GDP-fucose transporter), member C1
MQIEVTSPTTHMVVTAARGVAQSSLAVALLGEVLTTDRVGSMAMILGGSALYGWARDRYAQGKKAASDEEYLSLSGKESLQEPLVEPHSEKIRDMEITSGKSLE